MLEKKNQNISLYNLFKRRVDFHFDNAVQRGFCWDMNRKSLLIDSILRGYPIPPFYAVELSDGGGFDMLDGKQRINTILEFMDDKFPLKNVEDIETDQGAISLEGKLYSELPESLAQDFKSFMLLIYYFKDATQDEIADIFYRLNNGKPLTAFELTRVKIKALDAIQEIAQHTIFTDKFSKKNMEKFVHEEIVAQAHSILYQQIPSFVSKDFRKYLVTIEITENEKEEMILILDVLRSVHKELVEDKEKQVASRILTKTHFVSLMPVIQWSLNNDAKNSQLVDWIKSFFGKGTEMDEIYVKASRSGGAKPEYIRRRKHILLDSFISFVKNKRMIEQFEEQPLNQNIKFPENMEE